VRGPQRTPEVLFRTNYGTFQKEKNLTVLTVVLCMKWPWHRLTLLLSIWFYLLLVGIYLHRFTPSYIEIHQCGVIFIAKKASKCSQDLGHEK
jgi:hypothetical protein